MSDKKKNPNWSPSGNFSAKDAPPYEGSLQCMRCGFCLPTCPTFVLSGRERSSPRGRVALARALVLRPAVLLADEPTGNLDKGNSEQVHELLLELNAELSMTLVVVTHNMELASQMTRRVTISDGRLKELQ